MNSPQQNYNYADLDQNELLEEIERLKKIVADQTNQLKESEHFLLSVLDMFPQNAFWKDRNCVYQGANRHFLEAAALNTSNEIKGKTDFDLPLAEHAEIYQEDDREVMQSGQPKLGIIEPFFHADEGKRWLETNKMPVVDLQGDVVGVFGTFYDITDQKRDQETLKQQLETIEATIDGIGIVENEVYIYVNPSFVALLGYESADEILGKSWLSFCADDQRDHLLKDIAPIVKSNGSWQGEAKAKRKDGTPLYLGVSMTLTDSKRIITVIRDISDLKEAQDKITEIALHDDLTGLPNRRLLTKRMDFLHTKSQQDKNFHYAILYFDLDRFKIINDSLGHSVGDKLLKEIAQRLDEHKRENDLAVRLGGDEFVMLIEDIEDTHKLSAIAERLLENLKEPIYLDTHKIHIEVSLGIAFSNPDHKDSAELLRDADIAMYEAKSKATYTYKFFDDVMHQNALERLTLETDLHEAIISNQLIAHYQPIYELESNKMIGCEALVRWNHPEKGLIPPSEFIPIAEDTGLINMLDRWVIWEGCKKLSHWKRNFPEVMPFKVSFNISATELHDENLINYIELTLSDNDLNGNQICLEITESILINDITKTIEILDKLSSMGIEISIDDFGTGYSSLNYIHKLPVHNLKIDGSFICEMNDENNNYKVVSAITALCTEIGFNTIAEGIETYEQLEQCKSLKCKYGQGNYFSKAVDANQFEKIAFTKNT